MKALVQRVSQASVRVDGKEESRIGRGLLIFLGVGRGDGDDQARWVAEKCANLRIFEDGAGKMNLSLGEVGGEALVVSQFTLYGDCRKGRRPAFTDAAAPDEGERLYEVFTRHLVDQGLEVGRGIFGARMEVELVNDGPVTLMVAKEKS